jgi:Rrf2 family protein
MLKLTKKTEYAILAMQYIARSEDVRLSAKELSASLGISFEFLSKILQLLIKSDLVVSYQGSHGGYALSKPAESITIGEIVNAIEGRTTIVECFEHEDDSTCGRAEVCDLRQPLKKIQREIDNILYTATIADLNNIQ